MESSRTFQFGIFPRTNIAHAIKDVDEYESIINNFIDTEQSVSQGRFGGKSDRM